MEVLFSAGAEFNITEGAPVTQGAGVFGTHGIGVNAPIAAEVAAATAGLAMLIHMPKGGMFAMGL